MTPLRNAPQRTNGIRQLNPNSEKGSIQENIFGDVSPPLDFQVYIVTWRFCPFFLIHYIAS